MDDPRNTDNAWIETVAVSIHFPDQNDPLLRTLSSVGPGSWGLVDGQPGWRDLARCLDGLGGCWSGRAAPASRRLGKLLTGWGWGSPRPLPAHLLCPQPRSSAMEWQVLDRRLPLYADNKTLLQKAASLFGAYY